VLADVMGPYVTSLFQNFSNETLFFIQLFIISLSLLGAVAIGRGALESVVSLFAALMNLLVLKEVSLFGLIITPTDAFTIGGVFGLNLIHEFYGYKAAKTAIWTSFFTSGLMAIFSQIHLSFTAAPCDTCSTSYAIILTNLPRLVATSMICFLIVMFLDTWWYRWLAQRKWSFIGGVGPHGTKHYHIVIRNLLCIAPTQFIDTLLFSVIGLSGIIHHMGHVILISYTIKLIAIISVTPFIVLARKIHAATIRNHE
jgi:uncharacterized integral membrane protein (TIGR00697 family)